MNPRLYTPDLLGWQLNSAEPVGFMKCMTFYPEYRNVFYYRIGGLYRLINWLCPQVDTLFIQAAYVGEGLFIQHGFSTIITADHIGKNCWINQQVTIGYNGDKRPTILDNVTVNAGAKVIGGVTVGNNVIIGANCVVVKDVPDNCTVVGVPAKIIKRNGTKV
jgi:serine O-acetyltransferase